MTTMNTLIVLGLGLLIALSALSLYGKKIEKQEEANLKQEEANKRRWVVEEQASGELPGTEYKGEVRNEMRSGQGTMTWSNGDQYVGSWASGNRSGQGTMTWSNGDQYVGSWASGNRSGQGTMTWSNGDRYDGSWWDDKRQGEGAYIWSNGDKYVGSWGGNEHFFGTYVWANGDKYVGQFIDRMPHFYGTKTWANGKKYEGQWSKHKLHGKGTSTYPDGSKYYGGFLDDKYHGFGIVTRPDGSEYSGVYTNGNYAPYEAPTTRKLTPTAHFKLTEESGRKLLGALHRLEATCQAQLDGMSDGMDRGALREQPIDYYGSKKGDEERLASLTKVLEKTGSLSKKDNDEREGLIKKIKKADAELAAVEGAGGLVSSLVNIGVGAAVGHVLAKAIVKSK
jgi:hypothetical protein